MSAPARPHRSTGAYDVDFNVGGAAGGGYHPPNNPDITRGPYPADVVRETAADSKSAGQVLDGRDRASMPASLTSGMASHATGRPAAARTEQDARMIRDPHTSMSAAGISRNHKLADSSVYAIMVALWDGIVQKRRGVDAAAKELILEFFSAMTGDRREAGEVYELLTTASRELDRRKVTQLLNKGTAELSMSYPNLRFGDAQTNQDILFAFDPNVRTDGTATPLSERIRSAGMALAKTGLIDKKVLVAAFTRAVRESTGEELSSSYAIG